MKSLHSAQPPVPDHALGQIAALQRHRDVDVAAVEAKPGTTFFEFDLDRGPAQKVIAAHDVRDALVGVIDHTGHVVRPETISSAEHEIIAVVVAKSPRDTRAIMVVHHLPGIGRVSCPGILRSAESRIDDFAIGAPDAHMADVLLDMLDDHLTIPIKRQGHLDMYNGVDILQTRHYVRLSCTSFIDKISEKYLATWMS